MTSAEQDSLAPESSRRLPHVNQEKTRQVPVHVLEFEHRDESQIIAEMRGEIIEDLVYDIMIGGRRIVNLSILGVREATRRRGNVEILDNRIEETAEEIRCLVRVRDNANRIDVLGASAARKDQSFAFTLAVNKAERNAFAKLIPAKLIATLIDEFRKRKNPGSETTVETPSSPSEWHVPLTKTVEHVEGVSDEPIFHKQSAVGVANISQQHSELSAIPDNPVKADSGPVKNFLIKKVLEPLKAKHPEVSWELSVDDQGFLQAVLLKMELDPERMKEVLDACGWTFAKANEKSQAGQL